MRPARLSKRIAYEDEQPNLPQVAGEPKRYILDGKLFFGSALRFHTFFDVDNDPEQVVLQMSERATEYSSIELEVYGIVYLTGYVLGRRVGSWCLAWRGSWNSARERCMLRPQP